MTRLLKLAVIILSIISLASAQIVETLNTPIGPFTQGAKVAVTWSLIPGNEGTTATGDFSATDSTTKNVIPIDPAVPLAPKTYLWEVKVPPGTYFLGLNDGSGPKQSGEVVVKAPADGAAPAPAPAPAAPAPATSPPPASAVDEPKTAPAESGDNPAESGDKPAESGDKPAEDKPKEGSASSIFSGYNIVFSLLGVAIAMVQF